MIKQYFIDDFVFHYREESNDLDIIKENAGIKVYFKEEFRVHPNDIVIDIGAHIGTFSVIAASVGATVYAYEPSTDSYEVLLKNIAANGSKVYPHKLGIMGSAGERELHLERHHYASNNFYDKSTFNDSQEVEKAECITLDDVFAMEKLDHCDFLKLDCEGSEVEILENSSNLDKVNRIALEYHLNLHPLGVGEIYRLKEILRNFKLVSNQYTNLLFEKIKL